MKKTLLAFLLALATPAFAQQTAPEIAFDSVADFVKLPDGMNFGEVPGVSVDSKGNVYVFTRSNSASGPAYAPTAAQLLEFAPDGKFLREIGKGLYAWSFAHSVRIDKDDNIWAIDKGSDMIVKFNQAGRIMWVFGRRKESAESETKPWEHLEPAHPGLRHGRQVPAHVQHRHTARSWNACGERRHPDGRASQSGDRPAQF